MVSSHTLLTMSSIMQQITSKPLPLGGVQRIFSGDFYQLPPVPNINNGDMGEAIYRIEDIARFIPHKITLVRVSNFYSFIY